LSPLINLSTPAA